MWRRFCGGPGGSREPPAPPDLSLTSPALRGVRDGEPDDLVDELLASEHEPRRVAHAGRDVRDAGDRTAAAHSGRPRLT